jgi:hypothetical protein
MTQLTGSPSGYTEELSTQLRTTGFASQSDNYVNTYTR